MPHRTKSKTRIKAEALRARKKIRDGAVNLIKTIMIYLLTVSMLAFAGIYINGRQGAGRPQTAPEIPPEKMRVFEFGGALRAQINVNHITPAQITITAGSNSFTAIYSDVIQDVCDKFRDAALGVFGGGSVCSRLDAEEGAKLWRECAEAENSVYIRYAGEYLYSVIHTFLDKTRDEGDERYERDAYYGELAMVQELFIVDKSPVFGVARDISGNIAVFIPEEAAAQSVKTFLSAGYLASAVENTAGVMQCVFLKGGDTGNNIENLKLPDSFHIYNNFSVFTSELAFANPLLDDNNIIDTNQACISGLFGLLNFNVESSISNLDPESGALVFEDGKNAVNFYERGLIVYDGRPFGADVRGGAGGIHLSKFLAGYGDAENYTFYEKIKAASVFVSGVAGELTGNEAGPRLKNITSDRGGALRFVFSYYYEGIKIKIGNSDEAIEVLIDDDRIVRVKINAVNISSQNMNMIKHRDPIWGLGVIDAMISSDREAAGRYNLAYDAVGGKFIVNAFELVYDIDYAGGGAAAAAWEIK